VFVDYYRKAKRSIAKKNDRVAYLSIGDLRTAYLHMIRGATRTSHVV